MEILYSNTKVILILDRILKKETKTEIEILLCTTFKRCF